MVHSSSGGRDPRRPRTRAQGRLELPPPDPQPSRPRTSEGHVTHDTASSTHRPHTTDERGTPSPLSLLITSPGAHTRRAAPSTPSPVDSPQPAAPPQPIVFTLGTDPAQLMQAFFSGLAQFTSQASTVGQTTQDPFVSALREFERHHTPRYDGSGGYDAAEEWLAAVQVTFCLLHTSEAYMAELATTLLDRDARHKWSSQEPQHNGVVRAMSWERFSDIFRVRFMGEHQLFMLRYRFETLTQGSRTAHQYGELFLRLSRYAPELVAVPTRRRARFI
jgi:Retrotransposon gag protein